MMQNVYCCRLLRETVLSIACQMGDEDALNEAFRIFQQWIDKTIRLLKKTQNNKQILNFIFNSSYVLKCSHPRLLAVASLWTWGCWCTATAWRSQGIWNTGTRCFKGTRNRVWRRRRTSSCTDWRRWRTWSFCPSKYKYFLDFQERLKGLVH